MREKARIEFRSKYKCLRGLVCFELLVTLIFLVCLYVLQIDQLWDEKYLDTVVEDWQRNAFIAVLNVDKDKNCPMGTEDIGKANFWGVREGCICNTDNFKNVSRGFCNAWQVGQGCKTVVENKQSWLSIINGHKYCGVRGPKLNLETLQKPAPKKPGEEYKCMDEDNYKLCGSPSKDLEESKVFCVLKVTGQCPLTSISFDKDGKIKGTIDAKDGPPVINLQLSQNGAPCIYNNESFSSVGPEKVKMRLFPSMYYQSCPPVVFGGEHLTEKYMGDDQTVVEKKTFKHSKLYKKVPSFKGVSEYQLL